MGNKRFERLGLGAAALAVAAVATMGAAGGAGAIPIPGTGSDTGSSQGGDLIDLLNTGSSILQGGPTGPSGPPAVQKCNASTKSGNDGITETIHQLGVTGPTSFVLRYETYNVPDRIEVFYQGGRVLDTGFVGDNTNEGTGSATVRLPRGLASSVLVRVTGGSRTDWDYTVACPGA